MRRYRPVLAVVGDIAARESMPKPFRVLAGGVSLLAPR